MHYCRLHVPENAVFKMPIIAQNTCTWPVGLACLIKKDYSFSLMYMKMHNLFSTKG